MSFLFHRRTRKVMRIFWSVVAVLVIVSMVILFAPGISNWIMAK